MSMRKKRLRAAIIGVLCVIPALMIIGVMLGDRNYNLISTLIVLVCIMPFFLIYEKKKPKMRELVALAVMCALAVMGRLVFNAIPQFKPILAIIIITALAFGAEAGFMCGALSMLLSNLMIGQGPWTPWQMFACGIVGFIAGCLSKTKLMQSRWGYCAYGIFSGYLYGCIVNIWTIFSSPDPLTIPMIFATYALSFPFDTFLALSTALFLILLGKPLLEKLHRLQVKYGLAEHDKE